MVGFSLRHYSAVDVSVVGVRVTEVRKKRNPSLESFSKYPLSLFQERSYRGTLTSVFPDGARRERRVEGVVQRRYLNNIRPEYSRVYRIKPSVTVDANQHLDGDDDHDEEVSGNRRSEAVTPFPATRPASTTSKSDEWSMGSGWEDKSRRRTDLMVSDQIKNNAEERQSAVISGSGGAPEAGLGGYAAIVTSKVTPLVACLLFSILLN